MPLRPTASRGQGWLFPLTVDELLPDDHPARFVAAFIESLQPAAWLELGMGLEGERQGAPAYHPKVLLSVWLYGFMIGIRSARKLELACHDQLPFLWLTGFQYPDHNTLWRFYQSYRTAMRRLLKRTVQIAVRLGLVDLAVQAVDGTKIGGNAARQRTKDEAGLRRLLERTDKAIAELEARNETGGEAGPPRLLPELASAQGLRQKVQAALAQVVAGERPKEVNLTDREAVLVKSRQGVVAGYNAQAVVSPIQPARAKGSGRLITAAEVVAEADDHSQLLPMLEQAEVNLAERAELSLADGGYHSGRNLAACESRGQKVAIPEEEQGRYHKDKFSYDGATDSYTCPEGQTLCFSHVKRREGEARVYRALRGVCKVCPAFGQCTKDRRQGRSLQIGPYEAVLRRHRAWMAEPEVKALYRQRQGLVEPVFGIVKEQQGGRRFLLRGLAKVRAEWTLLAIAFNLRTLARVWQGWRPDECWTLTEAAVP